jgi:4-hydroxy-tetrahydrodipicolinate reductase
MDRLRTAVLGLGSIGLATARLVLDRRGMELAGAADADPAKAGRDLAELLGGGAPTGLVVERDFAALLARVRPEVVFLCTSSRLPEVADDVRRAARAGAHVVSSCEEMLLPDLQHPELARALDDAARAGGVTVVGTGVNPGFVLDFLPAVASAVCREVRRVVATRVVDAGTRREALQRKVGAGMEVAEFRRLAAAGRIGHVGMRESVALLGRALALDLDAVTQTVEPVVAERDLATRFFAIPAGRVAGIRNLGIGSRGGGQGGERLVELRLEMFVGAPDPRDEIRLDGDPPVHLRLEGGVPGDDATAAILVNTARQAAAAAPGLKTVLDLPPPRLAR